MSKGVLLLALFIGIAAAQGNLGDFFADSFVNAYSGVDDAFRTLETFPLSNQTKGKFSPWGNLTIYDGLAFVTDLNLLSETAKFDSATTSYTYSGFEGKLNFTFKFNDPFNTTVINGTVSGYYAIDKEKSYIKVTYSIDPKNKGPAYAVDTSIQLTPPVIEFSDPDPTVAQDISPWLKAETFVELQALVNTKISTSLNSTYEKRAAGFEQYILYTFSDINATLDHSILSIHGQNGGLKVVFDGSIVNYSKPTSVIGDFDPALAPIQSFFTKEFITDAITYPIAQKHFNWTFPDASYLKMPDLDFKAADLYFIFPDSIGQFSAIDPLKAACKIESTPVIVFNTDENRLEVTLTLTCSIDIVPGTGAKTHIMDLSVDALFLPDITLAPDTKLLVQLSDTIIKGSVKVTNCLYNMQDRQQAIIDTLVEEALEAYDSEHYIWGTNYQVLPMKGAYYQVRTDGILFYGSHH